MNKYNRYKVVFVRKYKPDQDVSDLPVNALTITILANDITDALTKAWNAVMITKENYEVEEISKDGVSYC